MTYVYALRNVSSTLPEAQTPGYAAPQCSSYTMSLRGPRPTGPLFPALVLAVVLLASDAGRRGARAIARPDHLVERALVVHLHLLLDRLVLHHEKAPALRVAAVGRAHPGPQDLPDQLVRYRVRLQ